MSSIMQLLLSAVPQSNTVGIFYADSYSANLWAAVPLTTYQSATTGGAFIDVAPQIRTASGQTPGTAKIYNTGTATITATNTAPFGWYGNSMALPTSYTSGTDLTYTSNNLGSNQILTWEAWVYCSVVNVNRTLIATNNFGGGYYPAWVFYIGATGYPTYFSNPSGAFSSNTQVSVGWNHIAMCCDGTSTLKMFQNGTMTYNGGYGPNGGQSTATIGNSYWDGFGGLTSGIKMCDNRIYTGVQKYTGSFTVSTTDPDFGGAIIAA